MGDHEHKPHQGPQPFRHTCVPPVMTLGQDGSHRPVREPHDRSSNTNDADHVRHLTLLQAAIADPPPSSRCTSAKRRTSITSAIAGYSIRRRPPMPPLTLVGVDSGRAAGSLHVWPTNPAHLMAVFGSGLVSFESDVRSPAHRELSATHRFHLLDVRIVPCQSRKRLKGVLKCFNGGRKNIRDDSPTHGF
jgi:hypothetical protein